MNVNWKQETLKYMKKDKNIVDSYLIKTKKNNNIALSITMKENLIFFIENFAESFNAQGLSNVFLGLAKVFALIFFFNLLNIIYIFCTVVLYPIIISIKYFIYSYILYFYLMHNEFKR
jgi:hypothetical protein